MTRQEDEAGQQQQLPDMPGVEVLVAAPRLNVRSAPATDAEVLWVLNQGDPLTIDGGRAVNGVEWAELVDHQGWVQAQYLTSSRAAS